MQHVVLCFSCMYCDNSFDNSCNAMFSQIIIAFTSIVLLYQPKRDDYFDVRIKWKNCCNSWYKNVWYFSLSTNLFLTFRDLFHPKYGKFPLKCMNETDWQITALTTLAWFVIFQSCHHIIELTSSHSKTRQLDYIVSVFSSQFKVFFTYNMYYLMSKKSWIYLLPFRFQKIK